MQPIGIQTLPLRTPTLPPATHTNTYIVGQGQLSVFDPASPFDDEQKVLLDTLDAREHEVVARIVLTHHHHDHIMGAHKLQDSLRQRGRTVPIVAHPRTAQLVAPMMHVDEFWEDGETRDCGGIELTATHTPGHAPGHLVFQSSEDRSMIAGDMVAGIGTILIDPTDGNLEEYLASLQRMRDLTPSRLLPAHGPQIDHADDVLSMYIAHRHLRTDQIRSCLEVHGRQTPRDIVPHVYPELDLRAHGLAARQIESHLLWLKQHGMVKTSHDNAWWIPAK